MSVNNKVLREGIISKLKEYNAYVDNELPDYIMVMLANKKTIHQVNNDLQLFLGEHTDVFTEWLQKVLSNQDLLREGVEGTKKAIENESKQQPDTAVVGSKRKRSAADEEADSTSPNKVAKTTVDETKKEVKGGSQSKTKLKLDLAESQRANVRKVIKIIKPDQDLRELIALRKSDKERERRMGSEEKEDERPTSSSISSVVKLVERPRHSDEGGSRLLHRAILGIRPERSKGGVSRVRESSGRRSARKATSGIEKDKKEPQTSSADVSKDEPVARVTNTEEEGEEVIVELDGDETEQDFIDEFRKEQQLDEATKKTVEELAIEAVKKVLPKSNRIRLISGDKSKEIVEDDDSSDLRELLNRNRDPKKGRTRFIVTLSEAGDRLDHITTVKPGASGRIQLQKAEEPVEEEEPEEEEHTSGSGLPERCRFWPNCKNGDTCPFHHPTVPCKLFPNCKYGKKCLFVHPQCKFDSRCMRADCPYLHTAPKHLAFQPQVIPPVVQAPVAPVFRQPFNQTFSYSRSGSSSRPSSKYPNKSALTWTPTKASHISERKFAVPDDQTTSLTA